MDQQCESFNGLPRWLPNRPDSMRERRLPILLFANECTQLRQLLKIMSQPLTLPATVIECIYSM